MCIVYHHNYDSYEHLCINAPSADPLSILNFVFGNPQSLPLISENKVLEIRRIGNVTLLKMLS